MNMNMEMVVMMKGVIEIAATFSLLPLVQGALVEPLSPVENAHQLIKAQFKSEIPALVLLDLFHFPLLVFGHVFSF